MKNNIFFVIFFSLILLCSCIKNDSGRNVDANFKKYLSKTLKKKALFGKYYILNMETCTSCIDRHLSFFVSNAEFIDENITIIFAGKNFNKHWQNDISFIKQKHRNTIIDNTKNAIIYDFNLADALYVVLTENESSYFLNVTEENEEKVFDMLIINVKSWQ